ncbi:MAG: hypothetical protein ACRDWS_03925 [Acidimicrobiia bacterium]
MGAALQPDDNGHIDLAVGDAPVRTYYVHTDPDGVTHLIPVEPYESLPAHVREVLDEQRRNPKPLVHRPRRPVDET